MTWCSMYQSSVEKIYVHVQYILNSEFNVGITVYVLWNVE